MLKTIPIPLPSLEKQKAIAQQIEAKYQEANNLEQEAERALATAKAQVERIILSKHPNE